MSLPIPGDWVDDALCRRYEPDLHYPASWLDRAQIARARAVCAHCPVREACLAWALRTGEPDGIWGGLTPRERGPLSAPRRAPRARDTDTCCAAGHPWTPENTYARPDRGGRMCRTCQRERAAARRAANRRAYARKNARKEPTA